MRRLIALRHGAARRLPGLQAAVEHGHVLVPGPFQHPPQAATVIGAVAVIDHGLHVVGKAFARDSQVESACGWQRVAPAGGGLIRRRRDHAAMRAGRACWALRCLSRSAYGAPRTCASR